MAHLRQFFSVKSFEIVETRKLFRQSDNNKNITSVILRFQQVSKLTVVLFSSTVNENIFIKTFENGPHQEGICLFSYFPKLGSYLKNLQMASIYIKLNHKSMSTQYYYHLLHYQQRAIIFAIFH